MTPGSVLVAAGIFLSRIAGLVRLPLDLAVRGSYGGVVVPTPAFYEQYRHRIGGFVSSVGDAGPGRPGDGGGPNGQTGDQASIKVF